MINNLGDDYKNSVVIGVEGRQGDGKSSLINLILNEVTPNKKNLVIEFNPWSFSNRNDLIYELLISIAKGLDRIGYGIWWDWIREKTVELANKIENLMSNVCRPLNKQLPRRRNAETMVRAKEFVHKGKEKSASINIGLLSAGYKGTWSRLESTDKQLLEKKRDEIYELLREREKRTIIVIECIDQLDREQTKNIFELVRFAANAPNTIFVLTYDRNELCKRMNNESGVNFEVQLKEMIKCTYSLPKRAPQDTHSVSRAIIDELNLGDFDEKQSK